VPANAYVYVRSEVAFSKTVKEHTFNDPRVLDALHIREVWLPKDPTKAGLIREGGKDTSLRGAGTVRIDGGPSTSAGADNGTCATDAAGRHGKAAAFTADGERTEYIFDTSSLTYLGERSHLVTTSSRGKAGTLTSDTAVFTRAVVGKVGELPPGKSA